MRVRDFAPADREACLAVFDSNVPAYFLPEEREPFAAFLDALPGPFLVVENEAGGIVGCGGIAVEADGGTVTMCWGMVRQELHGTGLGTLLLRERLERARAAPGGRVVALNTSQHTRGFYERFGFVTESVLPDGYAPGLDRCELRLELRTPS